MASVLIVDDHAQVRQLLRVALEIAGYDILEADAPRSAEQHLARSRPDAVVLNLQDAETAGLELLACLRRRADLQAVPILFLAGRYAEDLRWEAARAGADWFGERPLSMLEFQGHVRTLIHSGRPLLKAVTGRGRRLPWVGLGRTGT